MDYVDIFFLSFFRDFCEQTLLNLEFNWIIFLIFFFLFFLFMKIKLLIWINFVIIFLLKVSLFIFSIYFLELKILNYLVFDEEQKWLLIFIFYLLCKGFLKHLNINHFHAWNKKNLLFYLYFELNIILKAKIDVLQDSQDIKNLDIHSNSFKLFYINLSKILEKFDILMQ